MPISFTCPHCGKQTNVADQYGGQTGPCSHCGQTITIPLAGLAAAVPPPPAPAKSAGAGTTLVIVAVVCLVGLLGCGGILVALLLPAVQAAREAARRSQCSNNLKQIAIAFHNYHDVYKSFPPAYIADADGKPMHSWRVLILPFMEQQALYNQYRFDEPWDSPANRLVTNTFIPAYQCPSSPNSPGSTETNYMVITGPGTVFEGSKPPSMMDIRDGTSNTILVVEVTGTGKSWAEPVDLDASQVAPPFTGGSSGNAGSQHPGGMNTALCDGSVRFLASTIDPATFKAFTTRAGGEAVPMY